MKSGFEINSRCIKDLIKNLRFKSSILSAYITGKKPSKTMTVKAYKPCKNYWDL